jgi:hypothetical protein
MEFNSYSIAIIFFALASLTLGQNKTANAITIYNDNLGIVRETRVFDVKSGISTIQVTDVAQQIIPTSVKITFNGTVLEQNYRYDLANLHKILFRYIDMPVILINDKNEKIEGTLLSVMGDQIVLKKNDGSLTMIPNMNNYKIDVGSLPEGLIAKPTLVWMINSNKSGKENFEISYQTRGMSWKADYVAVLSEKDDYLDLNAWVNIENNSGATYKNAKLKLVAGDVNIVQDNKYDEGIAYEALPRMKSMVAEKQFEERSLFEYHIYELQRPATLLNNEAKQISLFDSKNIKAQKRFVFNRKFKWRGSNNKVEVYVDFVNSKENNLGLPMPKGKIRVFKKDNNSLEFIGEDMIDHTTTNETIKLKLGEAFDIVAEKKTTESRQLNQKTYRNSYEVTIKNRKKEKIEVFVYDYSWGNFEISQNNLSFEKEDAQTFYFKVPVESEKEFTLKYTVTQYYY